MEHYEILPWHQMNTDEIKTRTMRTVVEGWLNNQMAGPVGARHLFDFRTDLICELGHPWAPLGKPSYKNPSLAPFYCFLTMKTKIGKLCVKNLNMLQEEF